ncbi:valine--tRNA ligase [Haliscomenobacter hydrossis]|uniref:Valine--tRNA ligase n=1 Tax=Haliscomenobacter hydrossis (strain ATCC 27775 / DSM 1100 / LMG 10767 / O) TaxID=760192 RepID=F4KSN6_HALH1|nr:valine--tRNA ligase [Haliscomenobacter hydrossis]AEE48000.1 Valyl-tRNA synthetase [Haliscomenobacter hydrossis DSM 1100]
MSLSTRYTPQEIESKWYQHWLERRYFHSEPDDREPFTVVIPPPNVTGVLHMGHMLNNTIQDILIRKARLDGKNACWIPGTDHASIATEAKVVQQLRAQGIRKTDIGREAFLQHAFEWKDKYGGIILDQLKRLGASCDWERTRFTMEDSLSEAVIRVFVDLYGKKRIYRDWRITNWDPEAKTVLSNEEVIYSEENAQLFHLRYALEGDASQGIVIATQRPETIMADVAVAVHPDDERFQHLIGKNVLIPLIDRAIPIIADTYVDREFGTGALKITPAHDQNDYEIGQRFKLPVIDILTEDGKLNEKARILIGEDRFVARKKIRKLLEESGHLIKLEDYRTKIGRSERTSAVVEPRLTLQWFVDMKKFAHSALEAVRSGEVKFYPEHFWNMYNSWLNEDNVRDWCISRQLWWGQRIPAWYLATERMGEENHIFVADTAEDALAQAREKTGNADLSLADLRQEEDVVDTWFSSWLWPISVFDGFKTQEELKYYYPTSILVTGWDIMFFWVARMIMSGYEWAPELIPDVVKEKGAMPFRGVYFTGMVRDNLRRKMSKSLGNSPDALALLDNYGADGVRFGMLSSAAAGNDIIFDAPIGKDGVLNESKLCEQGRNFCNKMWNALRLIKSWEVTDKAVDGETEQVNQLAATWMEHKLNQTLAQVEVMFTEYRLSEALMTLYKFIWDDFCAWYLEMIKPAYEAPIDRQTLEQSIALFERMMTLLHPFMPFVTEEIWHQLRERPTGDDCVISTYLKAAAFDAVFIEKIERAKGLVTGVREIRNNNGLKQKELLKVFAQETPSSRELLVMEGLLPMVVKMASLEFLQITSAEISNGVAFLVGNEKFYVELEQAIDVEEERKRLQKELEYYQGFVKSVQNKLSNEKFVSGAPAEVVNKEKQKLADGEMKMKNLAEELGKLG